uniref:RNA-directed DNA polymerase from mobile element jockey n=1 Tax=Cacopsylla melanoneura TaxID=428564 RepID=A0A8D8TXB0_9HEMI
MKTMSSYFRKWRLKPNPSKTEVTCFHLNNSFAKTKLNVKFENQPVVHNFQPKYLGVTLDRTLSFKNHLSKTAEKLKARNNIIQKLCGSSWGASTPVLRTSALALVYSCAEYCAPAWINSSHCRLVDTQLNNTMRMISGLIRPTPTPWLPILSHIPPPDLRRQEALQREFKKISSNLNLPIHQDIEDETWQIEITPPSCRNSYCPTNI